MLDLARQRPRRGQREATCQLGRGQAAGQLQQGERVAAGLGDDPVAHPLVEPPGTRRVQQRASIAVAQPADRPLRQSLQLRPRRSARGRRTPGRPTRPAAAGRRTRGSAPRPGPATARRRPGRRAAAPRQRPTTGSAPPDPPGSDRPPRRRPARTPCRERRAADPAGRPSRSSIGAHSWCRPANASSISDSTPAARTTRHPEPVVAR